MRHLLPLFPRPSHYLGSETNAVHKDPQAVQLRWGLAFPDLYNVAMSHLGQKILYHVLNARPEVWAERVFAPHPDVAAILREHHEPLCTLESDTPLAELDILGFSLTHELCLTTVLFMLDLAGIPFRAEDRPRRLPLIIGGGGAMFNPEPVAPFLDCVVLGDGEEVVLDISRIVLERKHERVSKADLLLELSELPGIYVPSLFTDAGPGRPPSPVHERVSRVEKAVVSTLRPEDCPTAPVIPFGKAVHDRLTLEIARGCTRGCRFCQAGMTTRPVREHSLNDLDELMTRGLNQTGYEETSFLSLSTGDFSQLDGLFEQSFSRCSQEQVAISLPSLRVGSLSPKIMELMSSLRRTGATLAPEAATQRLRNAINKNITEEDLLDHARKLFELGWHSIKLYFMIGLPTETEHDLDSIAELCLRVRNTAASRSKRLQVTASVAPFVPKPHTPFQWETQDSLEQTRAKIDHLNRIFKRHKGLHLRWHQPEMSALEGVFSRGDRSLAMILEHAFTLGDILTSWTEFFSWPLWLQCFEDCGIDPESFLQSRDVEGPLPWDHINSGVSKRFLRTERRRALEEKITADCRFHACRTCGVCQLDHASSELTKQAGVKPIAPVVNQASRDQDSPAQVPSNAEQHDLSLKAIQYRLWYQKLGPAAYLSQLEMQTIIERALRRSQAPLSFSQGFHPKPHLSFGVALPVGVASLEEWVVVSFRNPVETGPFLERMNQDLPQGLTFIRMDPLQPKKKHPQPELESFLLTASSPRGPLMANWGLFLEKTHFSWHKKTKKGVKDIDLRPFVLSATPRDSNSIHLIFDWREGYINPLEVIKAVNPGLPPESVSLCKTGQFFSVQEALSGQPLPGRDPQSGQSG